jgi:hypothetical protein
MLHSAIVRLYGPDEIATLALQCNGDALAALPANA